MTFIEKEVAKENERRKQTYRGQVADYLLAARQDVAYNLPARPFPAVPKERVVEDVDGEQVDVDGTNPVLPPQFVMEEHPDGYYRIKTPLKIGVKSGSLRGV